MKTLALLLLSLMAALPAWAIDVESLRGPRLEELYFVIVRDSDAQLLALERGTTHLVTDLIRPVDIERLARRDDVVLSLTPAFHMMEMGFNLRRSPWDRQELRQAIASVIDREGIVRDLFGGYALALETFLPPISPYFEEQVPRFGHDVDEARNLLARSGWSWDGSNRLVDPSGAPLKPVRLLSPLAQVSPTTAELAQRLALAMESLGLPVTVDPLDFPVLVERLNSHDFDLFLLAWSLTRDPDNLFSFFHSSMDVKNGYNIPGLRDAGLDAILERLRFAPDETAARQAASEAQKALAELVPVIPLYSRYSVTAHSKAWTGFIASEKVTPDNLWSLLSIEPAQGPMIPFRWNLGEEPRNLNPLAAGSAYDWQILGLLYESLLSVDPYDLSDRPGLAESWTLERIGEEDKRATRLTFRLRPDLFWHDGKPLTARDVAFTLERLKALEVPRFFDSVRDMASVNSPDERTVVVTMDQVSFWHLHNIGGLPILPAHILEKVDSWRDWQPATTDHGEGLTELVGSGPFVFREYRPGQYVRLTRFDRYWRLPLEP
jgi:peptide/nickel transport system substrate-binding protein